MAKAPTKKGAAPKPPAHPLMRNARDWDREAVIRHLCDCLATSAKGIGSILKAGYQGQRLPDYSTIMDWLDGDAAFAEMYARAKEAQADYMADEIVEIADEGAAQPVLVDEVPLVVDGKPVMAASAVGVNHARLRVDARKWVAAKLKPRKYGDKLELGGQINHTHLVDFVDELPDPDAATKDPGAAQ